LARLGSNHKKLQDKTKAIEFYKQALPIAKELGERGREIAILIDLVFIYAEQEKYSQLWDALFQLSFKHWLVIPSIILLSIIMMVGGAVYALISIIIFLLITIGISIIFSILLWQTLQICSSAKKALSTKSNYGNYLDKKSKFE